MARGHSVNRRSFLKGAAVTGAAALTLDPVAGAAPQEPVAQGSRPATAPVAAPEVDPVVEVEALTTDSPGGDFMVDTGTGPQPVPYGVLSDRTGRLTGTLTSGDPVDVAFVHDGALLEDESIAGSIRITDDILAPEPGLTLLHACAMICTVLLRRSRSCVGRPEKGERDETP